MLRSALTYLGTIPGRGPVGDIHMEADGSLAASRGDGVRVDLPEGAYRAVDLTVTADRVTTLCVCRPPGDALCDCPCDRPHVG